MLYRTLTLLLQYFDFAVSSTQLISVISSSCNEVASSCDCSELEVGSSGFVSSLAGLLSDAEAASCSGAGSSVGSSIGFSAVLSAAGSSASVRPFSSSAISPS